MKLFTYTEIETKVRKELDLQDEDNFIGNDEMAGFCNDAIDVAEAEIIKIHEDYLLTKSTISLVSGTKTYSLPSNIYAQKIREFIYVNGTRIYPIMRIRDPHKFYQKAEIDEFGTSESEYVYILVNETEGTQDKISLSPTPTETGNYGELWYIRNANRIPMVGEDVNGTPATRSSQLATVIDIPEWTPFIVSFMKMKCIEKEKDAQRYAAAEKFMQGKLKLMVDTLTEKVEDNQNEVPMDVTFYNEMN